MTSLLGIIEQLKEFDTALLANTIGYIDSTPEHEIYMSGQIASVTPGLGPTVGMAVTCEVDSSTPNANADWEPYYDLVRAMEKNRRPTVLVAKTVGSRPDHECVLGDGMAKELYSAGCVGIVTDGGVRDVEGLLTIPFAAYCRGRTVHHCAVRFRRTNLPIEVGGITVVPGDLIHANVGGVLKIPASCWTQLPARAAAMRAFENEAHCIFRLTDITVDEKQRAVSALLGKFNFTSPSRS